MMSTDERIWRTIDWIVTYYWEGFPAEWAKRAESGDAEALDWITRKREGRPIPEAALPEYMRQPPGGLDAESYFRSRAEEEVLRKRLTPEQWSQWQKRNALDGDVWAASIEVARPDDDGELPPVLLSESPETKSHAADSDRSELRSEVDSILAKEEAEIKETIKKLKAEHQELTRRFDGVLFLDPHQEPEDGIGRSLFFRFYPWPDKSSHPLHFQEVQEWILARVEDKRTRRNIESVFFISGKSVKKFTPLIGFVFRKAPETCLAVEKECVPLSLRPLINEIFAWAEKPKPYGGRKPGDKPSRTPRADWSLLWEKWPDDAIRSQARDCEAKGKPLTVLINLMKRDAEKLYEGRSPSPAYLRKRIRSARARKAL